MCQMRLPRLSRRLPIVAAPQPALFVEVRDVADLGQCQPPLAAFGSRSADLETAKFAGEIAQLLVDRGCWSWNTSTA